MVGRGCGKKGGWRLPFALHGGNGMDAERIATFAEVTRWEDPMRLLRALLTVVFVPVSDCAVSAPLAVPTPIHPSSPSHLPFFYSFLRS
jgi:hypothetical protein